MQVFTPNFLMRQKATLKLQAYFHTHHNHANGCFDLRMRRLLAAFNLPWGSGACSRAESSPRIWWELGCTGQVAGKQVSELVRSDLIHTEPAPDMNHQLKLQFSVLYSYCRIRNKNISFTMNDFLEEKKKRNTKSMLVCIDPICWNSRQLFLLGGILKIKWHGGHELWQCCAAAAR